MTRPHPRTRGMVLQPNGKWAYPPDVVAELMALYAQYGCQVVERITGIRRQTVVNIVRRHGGEVRTTAARPSFADGIRRTRKRMLHAHNP